MIDPNHIPTVDSLEMLARYVLQSSHVRRSDQSVKPNAFIPHPYPNLSVTRHLMATEEELWSVGEAVAASSGKSLYGRADIRAATCLDQKLAVNADATATNPNHANVSGWPADKPAQKIIAQELAAAATYKAREK